MNVQLRLQKFKKLLLLLLLLLLVSYKYIQLKIKNLVMKKLGKIKTFSV